ncbi:Na(+) H(+) antiporter subunit G [hydrothermal vent metagenome]|uniref:Na(+) H(+) antiporter subunit G n=1 Tax=hydrothermal vent metagenome TaxID=652676 RepID=A0A3B0VCQ4_9ZZZZ
MSIMEIIGGIFLVVGSTFLFLGGLGIYRMPDIYNRLQAGTKATTLGAMSLILGVGILEPSWIWKSLIIIIFIAYSNPISSHALARATYRRGHYPYIKSEDKEKMDAYQEVVPHTKKKEGKV